METSHYKTMVLSALIVSLTMVTTLSHKNMRKVENENIELEKRITETGKTLEEVEKENKKLRDSNQKLDNELTEKVKKNKEIQTRLDSIIRREKEKLPQATRGSLTLGSRNVPKTDTSMKSFMGYRAITAKSSPQYKLQHSGKVHTDNNGFRRVGNMYCIAVGTFYAENIGTILKVKLDNGNTFRAVVGDFKANKHTCNKNQQHTRDGSLIEFIVNNKTLIKEVKRSGDCSSLKGMEGNVTKMEVVGKITF